MNHISTKISTIFDYLLFTMGADTKFKSIWNNQKMSTWKIDSIPSIPSSITKSGLSMKIIIICCLYIFWNLTEDETFIKLLFENSVSAPLRIIPELFTKK